MKAHYNIPNITQSLKADFLKGEITIEDLTAQLSKANIIPFYCEDKAKKLLKI